MGQSCSVVTPLWKDQYGRPIIDLDIEHGKFHQMWCLDIGSHSILNSVAGNDGKKQAAWDLKGQLSDMRAKVSSYKDKVQRLDGENQQLTRHLKEQVAQNRELSSQPAEKPGD
ncbi:Carboxy-terminal kinesin 2 [Chelonia mydas]|uniref:Carboxy-terminal kinesin 2 n=1 Tax=Chelonia mydas TaxID=8469 RepID=M7AQV4_CHEMY|nr:Carboxy-terminal kinesin 2 [Chelonia mydas]